MLNIFVMTLGEIEFGDNFVAESLGAFETDVYVLLFIFLFLMPIVLMNLMVCNVSSTLKSIYDYLLSDIFTDFHCFDL